MVTKEDYDNSAGQYFIYEIKCTNQNCSVYNNEYGDIQAETIYPYIICGSCGEQITTIKQNGFDWITVEPARNFFNKIGML